MRIPLAILLSFVAAAPLSAAELKARSKIESVTVYPDGATVTRVMEVNLPTGNTTLIARDFPLSLDSSSLRVKGLGDGPVVIGAIDARRPRPTPPENLPEIEKRLEALKDRRDAVDGTIAAANARRRFAERFAEASPAGLGEKGEARPLAEWRAAFAAIAEEVAAADAAVRAANIKKRVLDRQIRRLEAETEAKPPRKMEVRVDLVAEQPTRAAFRVTYNVSNARWRPVYDARLLTGATNAQPSLELVRRAAVAQSTGEDWKNVALSVSTARTAKGGNAPDLRPLIVRYPPPPRKPRVSSAPARPRQTPDRRRFAARAPSGAEKIARGLRPLAAAAEREAQVETGGYQVLFRIPGRVSIAARKGTKSFRVASTTIAPELIIRTTPALSTTAYLEASFKQNDEAPLLPGRVALYRDGSYVGRGRMALTPKEATVRLGFGADDLVKVSRVAVRRSKGSSGFISSSKTDERDYKITVRNGHAIPVRIVVEDRIPVSENDEIEVALLPVTTKPTTTNVRDRRGVLAWEIAAKPGSENVIRLAWRVSWPEKKSVIYRQGRRR